MRRAASLLRRVAVPATAVVAFSWKACPARLDPFLKADEDAGMYLVKEAAAPGKFAEARVEGIRDDGRGSRIVTLGLKSQFHRVGAKGQHFVTVRNEDGSGQSSYAPVSRDGELGVVQLVATAGSNGALETVAAGDVVHASGPTVHEGVASGEHAAVGIIADTAGAATAFQAVQRLMDDPRDATEVRVLYEAKSDDEVVLRNRFDALALVHPRLKVQYAATESASAQFDGFAGAVDAGMVARTMPPPSPRTQVVVAGSAALRARMCGADGLLAGMKYGDASVKCLRQ